MLRFHLPLIEPDLQISRIRLSDKGSSFRPRNIAVAQLELDQTQLTMQIVSGVACQTPILHFVLLTQPPTEPDTGMTSNRAGNDRVAGSLVDREVTYASPGRSLKVFPKIFRIVAL
jgi:hypothetical protein